MDTYGVPESSFYNVLAGRRQTSRVCEAFRQEMIKRLLENQGQCSVQVDLDESETQASEHVPNSPRRKRKRQDSDSQYAAHLDDSSLDSFGHLSDMSPRRKKARIASQFTPQSPESMNSNERDDPSPSHSNSFVQRTLFPNAYDAEMQACSMGSLRECQMSKDACLPEMKRICLDDKKKSQIKDLVSELQNLNDALQHTPSRYVNCTIDDTFEALLHDFATHRKHKRKGLPIRSPVF